MSNHINESRNYKLRNIIYIIIGIIILLLVLSFTKLYFNDKVINTNDISSENNLTNDNSSFDQNNKPNANSLHDDDSILYPNNDTDNTTNNNQDIDSLESNLNLNIPESNNHQSTEDNHLNKNNNLNIINLYLNELIKANNTFKYLLNYTDEITNNY